MCFSDVIRCYDQHLWITTTLSDASRAVGQKLRLHTVIPCVCVCLCASLYVTLWECLRYYPFSEKHPRFPEKYAFAHSAWNWGNKGEDLSFFLSVWEFQSLTYISHLSLLFKGYRVKSHFSILYRHEPSHSREKKWLSQVWSAFCAFGSGNTQNLTPSAFFSLAAHWLHQIRKIKVKGTSIIFAAPPLTLIHLHIFPLWWSLWQRNSV